MNRSAWIRFLPVVALFVATGYLLFARPAERVRRSEPLSRFPVQVGDWEGRDLKIPEDALEVLGPGDFLERTYANGRTPVIDLFLAYFPSQSTGDAIHSPKNCLPGSGWSPIASSQVKLVTSGRMPINANRYLLAKGADRLLAIYWYQAHGRTVASEYWAKFYLIADAIRMNRTDGSLVRIITPVWRGETEQDAEKRAIEFAQQVVPQLDSYIPR